MANQILRVEGLGKCYRIRHQHGPRYTTIRDVLADTVRGLLSGRPDSPSDTEEDFWALRQVSFDVQRGEVLGIIGRNGAGKSTLLKVLSRITDPTEGRISIDGRVASLLEVGAGFHQELTGRENIFLNGAILGMTRQEIRNRFDEIVAFAEVEAFLDTPVKRYSSGMYMRLAFAVAAHLEPDILIVDEILAVGDVEFQRKCLGKMKSVASADGRTVLFVSHNMAAVETLCTKALLLREGRIVAHGAVREQVEAYLNDRADPLRNSLGRARPLSSTLSLEELRFSPNPVVSGERVQFTITLRSTQRARVSELSILLFSELGARVAILDLRRTGRDLQLLPDTSLTLAGTIESLPFVEGEYVVGVWIGALDVRSDFFDLVRLSVQSPPVEGDTPRYAANARGLVELVFDFDEQ